MRMWSLVLPFFLDGGFPALSDDGASKLGSMGYNILLHSQRGHGLSELPAKSPPAANDGEGDQRRTTVPFLAADIHHLISTVIGRARGEGGQTHTPEVHIIGVSQGGAAALAYYALYGSPAAGKGTWVKVKSIVACDTSPRTPTGNKEAWEERIRLALGASIEEEEDVYARAIGMPKLAEVTLPRWFPAGSPLHSSESENTVLEARRTWLEDVVSHTTVAGFVAGARALGSYDIALPLRVEPLTKESDFTRVLLLAGSLDGGGKVSKGLNELAGRWAEGDRQREVEYVEVEGAGHLPMIDVPERFCEVLGAWLRDF